MAGTLCSTVQRECISRAFSLKRNAMFDLTLWKVKIAVLACPVQELGQDVSLFANCGASLDQHARNLGIEVTTISDHVKSGTVESV
jgi:hypothetical protein